MFYQIVICERIDIFNQCVKENWCLCLEMYPPAEIASLVCLFVYDLYVYTF